MLKTSVIDAVGFWNDTVILVDKPYGYTSFQIVHAIQKAIRIKSNQKVKIGHAGTLDPLATGLLILCTGAKTKIINQFQSMKKRYSGTLHMGATRPTFDMESEIDQQFDTTHIHASDLEKARIHFLGEQMMTPPIHSAVKVNGKRAYHLARKGKEVELSPKPIVIHQFDIDASQFPEISFVVECSKGTYIRSLVSEFGKQLNSGAYLSSLKREAIGDYKLDDAWNLKELKDLISSAAGQ